MTRRHVIRILCELSEHKLVKVTHVEDPQRGHRANVYEFLWHEWMPHPKNSKAAASREPFPKEAVDLPAGPFVAEQTSLPSQEESTLRGAPQLPPSGDTSVSNSDTRVTNTNIPVSNSDIHVTRLVTQMSPRSQENKEKRTNKYMHPEGVYSSVPEQIAQPASTWEGAGEKQGETHGTLWQEWMRYSHTGNFSHATSEEPAVDSSLTSPDEENIAKAEGPSASRRENLASQKHNLSDENQCDRSRPCVNPLKSVSSHIQPAADLPEPAQHSKALVRKAWQLARKLLPEFWDNCKIQPDLRILFTYTSRALQNGYQEESIQDAFTRSLHQCHGHATDCGEFWKVSSTVHRAEKWLKANGSLWQPTPPEERQRIRTEISAAMNAWREQS